MTCTCINLTSFLSPRVADVSPQEQKTQVDIKQQNEGGQQLHQFGDTEKNNWGKSLSGKLASKMVRNNQPLTNANEVSTPLHSFIVRNTTYCRYYYQCV